ncbi:hypothetical protein T08_5157 [Trichinella sp. T8]|nr:hypothetical protein T08_14250 [Trichinella sp. T8]KRZ84024.1 hypothetical protein T08_5157 [Trichinella sp. T8]
MAPPSPSPLAGRAGQPVKPLAYPPQCLCHSQVTARRMVVDGSQDFWDVSSGNHLQHLFFLSIRCFPRTTGFHPAASAGPVVTKGFGTCDSLPVVLGASPSSPTTPEFVRVQGQRPTTPGSALSVPVSWPPLARLRLDSWLRTAFRLIGTGRQRTGVVVQAGGQLRIHNLPAAPASGLHALQVPGSS